MGNSFTDAVAATGSPALCTRDQVKARLGIEKDADNARIDQIVAALLPTLSNRLRRELMPHVLEVRTFEASHRMVSLGASDLRDATSVVLTLDGIDTTLVAGVDYVIWPIDNLTGTAGHIRLSRDLSISSQHFTAFGFVPMTITGNWGIWSSVEDVPEDVNTAAIETALSWLDRPSADIAMLGGGDPRYTDPVAPQTWDIPASAWRKLAPYNRTQMVV